MTLDFFSRGLWAQLPPAWQEALAAAPPRQLAAALLGAGGVPGGSPGGSAWPLSLLAFVAAARALALPRGGRPGGAPRPPCHSPRLHPLLRRHVKAKKQHEIRRLGKVLQRLSEATGCDRVVDVGSGQGHLSRFLAFGLGLSVTAVEGDGRLAGLAERFDRELLRELAKKRARGAGGGSLPPPRHPKSTPRNPKPPPGSPQNPRCPRHVAGRLDPGAPGEEFLLPPEPGQGPPVRNPLRGEPGGGQRVLLTGLHACGDLSVALLRHFARSPHVAAVTSAACCYMKLSNPVGYPLSSWVSGLRGHELSSRALEAACHALEAFAGRLLLGGGGDSSGMRPHGHRAALQSLGPTAQPSLQHPRVRPGRRALSLGVSDSARQQELLAFRCLALLLAPLVESLILLDRLLYLREQGFQCALLPLFDPRFSPRNLVLVAARAPLEGVLEGCKKYGETLTIDTKIQ
ncbi:protein RRNAD1 [Aythya fuligula]|uniref:Protein RRNAD1 n=1 Tax=Aythya fuligula TaxID=219594 RepID=A0A6J3E907_AYTFU|nr:protein RRNAD1 [Aythya fuligula]